MQPCVTAHSQAHVWMCLPPELCTAATAQWHNDSEHSSDQWDWVALSETNKEGLFCRTRPFVLWLSLLHIPPPLVVTADQLDHKGKWFWCISGLFAVGRRCIANSEMSHIKKCSFYEGESDNTLKAFEWTSRNLQGLFFPPCGFLHCEVTHTCET